MENNFEMELDLRAYWMVIRRWLWLIVVVALLAGGASYAASRWLMEPVYRAAVSLVIQPSSSLSGSSYQDILAGQRAAATYAEMLQALPLQEEALRKLGYTGDDLSRGAYALNVQPVRDTQVIQVSVESTDPRLAVDFANALVQTFIEENQERQSARYRTTQERLAEQIEGLEADIAEVRSRRDASSDTGERSQLEVQLAQLQDSLSRLTAANQSVQLAELQAVDLVSVVEPARLPRFPVRPRVLNNTLLAAVVGAMLAVGAVFLREYLDTSVRSPEEAKVLVNAPVLGQIWYEEEMGKMNGAGEHGIVLQNPLSLSAEAYRLLRANLQFASVDQPLRVLLVTSPAPSEGKSTVALNLALALGATGQRIVLIDADMRRPKVCAYAGVKREPGLSDLLLDSELELKRYLQPVTGAEGVAVLPPGRLPPNPTEVLGSRRMAEVLEKLRGPKDLLVIIDSPPILAAADAALLAARADGVLLVIEAGESDRRLVAQAVEQLQRSGARLLGTVLNKVPLNGKGSYYYYYYAEGERHAVSPWWKRMTRRRRERSKEQALD